MISSNFLTTVSYPNRNATYTEKLLAAVDGYLHLDCLRCRRVQVVEPGKAILCKNTPPSSWLATVLKVASYALLIPLLVALILKVLLHCIHRFNLIFTTINGEIIGSFVQASRHLTHLKLDNCQLLRDEEIPEESLSDLKILRIYDAPRLTDQGLAKLVKGSPLTELFLHNCPRIQGSIGFFPQLTKLHFDHCTGLNAANLNKLLSHCRLKSIYAVDCEPFSLSRLSDQNLCNLVSLEIGKDEASGNLTSRLYPSQVQDFYARDALLTGKDCLPLLSSGHLRDFRIENCPHFGEIPPLASKDLAQLEKVEISESNSLTGEDLASLLSGKKVKQLALGNCPQLAGRSFQGQDFSTLKGLKIFHCTQFPEESITALINGSSLERLSLWSLSDFKTGRIGQDSLQKMTSLHLAYLPNLTGQGFNALLSGKRIEYLIVMNCDQLDGIHCNPKNLQVLRYLDLAGLPLLSSKGLAGLLSLPQLAILRLDLSKCQEVLSPVLRVAPSKLSELYLKGANKLTPRAFLTLLSSPCLKILGIEAEDRAFFTQEGCSLRKEILKRLEELDS